MKRNTKIAAAIMFILMFVGQVYFGVEMANRGLVFGKRVEVSTRSENEAMAYDRLGEEVKEYKIERNYLLIFVYAFVLSYFSAVALAETIALLGGCELEISESMLKRLESDESNRSSSG